MGPVMVFFIYLANLIFNIGNQNGGDLVGSIVRYIIPIVFLWMGLIISSKFGGDGSKMAMGIAGKVGGNIKSYGQKAAWGGAKAVGRFADDKTKNVVSGGIGAAKMKLSQWNDDHKSASNTRATQFANRLSVAGANEKLVQESRKKWKEAGGVSDSEMARIDSIKGTKAEKMALALERAENKGFDKDPIKAAAQYQEALTALNGNKVYKDLFDGNIRKKNIDLEINANVSSEMARLGRSLMASETETIARKSFDKLDPGDWKEQNVERMATLNSMYGNSGVAKAAKSRIGNYAKPDKVTENMRGSKYDAGKTIFWV